MSIWRKIETEGLPRSFDVVLWRKKNGMMDVGYLQLDEVWWDDDRWSPLSACTHWMPLPKPPKE